MVRSRVQPGSLDRIVTFAEVPDRNAAEAVRGVVLSAEAVPAGDEADGDELWVHRLMGATVVDLADGAVKGVVREVHEQAASDVLILDTGHVVPVSFVVRQRGDVIEVEVPMGLWELID